MAENENGESQQFVTDRATSSISDLWKKEDYWAIWLGFALLLFSMILFFPAGPDSAVLLLLRS